MSAADTVDWVTFKPLPKPLLRLVCFPCAGGTPLDFRPWAAMLEPHRIEVAAVRLPGRETRIRQAPYRSLAPLLRVLTQHFRQATVKTAFFGHSMGALIGYELAQELRATDPFSEPSHLLVAGRIAPHVQSRASRLYQLSDEEFLKRIRGYEGTPPSSAANNALMRLLLPTLRADFELVETYEYIQKPKLNCPITAFGGSDDPFTPQHMLEAWRELTASSFRVRYLPGAHFFVRSARDDLIARLVEVLAPTNDGAAHRREVSTVNG